MRTVVVGILVFFAALYLFSFIFGPLPLSVNSVTTTKSDMFTVTGEGEASAIPDTAQFSVGVTEQATTVAEAQAQVNESTNAIVQALRELDIDEESIKTTNYSVNPNYDFREGQQITGYSVTQNLDIEVTPIEKANQAVDAATSRGANMVGSIQFTLNDEKQMEVEEQARKQAIEQAKEKARSIADTAGIRLGKLLNVQESANLPIPYFAERTLALDQVGGETPPPTDLQPGENTVSITVTLFYETL